MSKPLTTKAVDAARPGPTRREIPDGGTGLYLVVQPSGVKSWAVRYRFAGRPQKLTLDKPFKTLADARKLARDVLEAVVEGRDPARERQNSREQLRSDADLVDTVIEDFIARHVRANTPKSAHEHERLIRKNVLPAWKGRKVQSISKRDVVELLDSIVDRGAPITANRVLAMVRKLFGWAVERGVVDVSPAEGVKPPSAEISRDRVLSDRDIRLMWKAADKLGFPFGPMAQLLLLTGQRRSEVSELTWRELTLEGDEPKWELPAVRAKNGEAHVVPLSTNAVGILEGLPRIGKKPNLVFTTTGESAVSGYSNGKNALDKRIAALVGEEGEDAEPVPDWTFHDLRRTAASGMARLHIAPHIIEAVLNHRSGSVSGVAKVYNRHKYEDEKRVAIAAWGRFLGDLVGKKPASNVVEMRGRG